MSSVAKSYQNAKESPQDAEAVAQAREAVWGSVRQLQRNPYWSIAINHTNDSLDALIAAVWAECAAKVREVRSAYTNEPYSDFSQGWHEACDAITRKVEAP